MSTPPKPVFVDPPPHPTQDDEWKATAETLIESSGQWALIFAGDYQTAHNVTARIRKSRGVWDGHEWEVTARKTLSNTDSQVYARHVKALTTPNDEGDEQ